ncbi:MAG: type IV pilus assembly protein PilM, partial [Candidatus Omnitrophota bacterium]|nr:type IV pilus assembly protein PilM [Candidatus Omnitrophota bacterium]
DRISVGLDIGTQSIKCVKLKINGSAIELVTFDLEESQLDPIEALKKIKYAQSANLVNISFCGSATVIRYVNFLRMSKPELKQALKFEAQKHIPFSLDEVNLDAEILIDSLPENKMLVLIAALKKEFVQQRLKSLEAAGLRPNIIDIDSLALVNAFNFNYPKVEVPEGKSICLLNIGSTISNISIIDNGVPRLSRDIHSGGANFTKKLMDIFGIDFKAAEELKVNPDPEKADKIKAGVESVLTNLAGEIRTSFDYYDSQNTSNVARIFLSGGASKLSGLKEMLAGFLGIEVESWDPFKQIKISDNLDAAKLNQFSSQFNVAVGLALR